MWYNWHPDVKRIAIWPLPRNQRNKAAILLLGLELCGCHRLDYQVHTQGNPPGNFTDKAQPVLPTSGSLRPDPLCSSQNPESTSQAGFLLYSKSEPTCQSGRGRRHHRLPATPPPFLRLHTGHAVTMFCEAATRSRRCQPPTALGTSLGGSISWWSPGSGKTGTLSKSSARKIEFLSLFWPRLNLLHFQAFWESSWGGMCTLQHFLTHDYINPNGSRTQTEKVSRAKWLGSAFPTFPGPLK